MPENKSTNYQTRGNQLFQKVPTKIWIDNLCYDQEGKPILHKFNQRLKGVTNIEDTTKYKPNQAIAHSNVPRALGYNHDLLTQSGGKIRLLDPYETIWLMLNHPELIPELKNTYADTNSLVIFPKKGPNPQLQKKVAEKIMNTKLGNLKIPYVVSNLGIRKSSPNEFDDNLGFTFTKTDFTEFKEAPYLEKDQKVICKDGVLIPSPDQEQGINIWTPSSQSGLRRLCRYGIDGLGSWYGDLLDSSGSGWVQLVRDPKGLAKKLMR